ncbi:MAG: immune inhibitor A [Crocinitomicaceae bacterium]|nr:immune inhibitor A [Crocinitomicaceae bacterium]
MKRILTLVLFSLFLGSAFSQLRYSKVKIYTDSEGLSRLTELGVAVDHGHFKKETFFISDFSEMDISIMEANGFNYDILIDDVKAYYSERSKLPLEEFKNVNCNESGGNTYNPPIPVNHFENNSYAGFYKYQDMLNALDAMVAQYPNLITVKAPISNFMTHENRPIYFVKISDSPNDSADDTSEPNVMYTAIHHAREPLSMTQTIYYMWYLLENYATDDEVKFLVDNTEMFFVPCINPDGYIENESSDPSGFGMHRKNKRNVGTTNPGVDLNRNYSYGWNTTGVSSDVNSDVYPGTSAFSEPETQAMKWMHETYGFKLASNSHTYGDLILFPVGTTSAEFADHHDYFNDFTEHMAMYNGYVYQKSSGLYPASGDSDDYAYKVDIGVGLKDTVFAITPEVGDDFWPAQAGIVPTCIEMIHPNLILSHLAHKYLIVLDTDPNTLNSTTGDFEHSAKRLGLQSGSVTVSIEPLLNIQSVGAPIVYNLNIQESDISTISYVLDPAIQFGDEVRYVLNTEYGSWTHRDTIVKTYGSLTLQYSEDASNTANWSGNWSTTSSEFVSPSTSFTDSPNGNYPNNTDRTYEFYQDIDLTIATAASVSYYAKWDIEADYDYCQLQVSVDGGSSWIGQCTAYTVDGTSANGSVQPDGEPVYEGVHDWVLEEVNLSDYLGQTIRIRFQLESDGGVREDGFYFDDFQVSFNEDFSGLDEFAFEVQTIPNPANQQAFISLSKVITEGSMKVFNQAGQLVTSENITELTNKITVDTASLPQGVYTVIVDEKGLPVKPVKLVVMH